MESTKWGWYIIKILTAPLCCETNRQAPGLTGWEDCRNRSALYEPRVIREWLVGVNAKINAFLH